MFTLIITVHCLLFPVFQPNFYCSSSSTKGQKYTSSKEKMATPMLRSAIFLTIYLCFLVISTTALQLQRRSCTSTLASPILNSPLRIRTGQSLLSKSFRDELNSASNTRLSKSLLSASSKSIKNDPITITPTYTVAIGFWVLAGLVYASTRDAFPTLTISAIATLLTVQTGRVRFVFDDEAMEVKVLKAKSENGSELSKSENNFVGGANRWKYSSWKEWFFIPSKDFPILMYFKETQTKPEGQIHFFPVIMDGRELNDVLMKKVGKL